VRTELRFDTTKGVDIINGGIPMKTIFGVSGVAALLTGALAMPAAAQELGGRYQIAGKNFDGSSYGGTAEIVVTSRNTCRISWVTGGTTARGICMRNGPAFSAAYRMGSAVGLVIYDIKPDGTLEGLWTIADRSGVGGEVLTPLR
jgi:hypothetical protein